MKISKMRVIGTILVLMMLVLVSCSPKEETETKETETKEILANTLAFEGTLKFISEEKEFEIAYNDIYKMSAITADVRHIDSDGEESNNTVEGISIESILKSNGLSKKDFTGIRFTAGDGYAITVPVDIFTNKDVILAYKFDGELLDAKKMPLRVAINDVESMYYLSNVVSVELLNKKMVEVSETIDSGEIVMLETVTSILENEEFMYYDSNDMAVKVTDILTMVPTTGSSVWFVATDGYEKEEIIDIFTEGFIKVTGKDAPLFTGLDLPIGMNVKSIMTMAIGDTTFISIASAMEANETMIFDDNEGVKLSEVIRMASLEGDFYIITAVDGYSVEVTADSTKDAIVYIHSSGTISVEFDAAYAKETKVKDLLTITVGDGSQTEMVLEEVVIEEEKTGEAKEESEELWTITFDGLSDGAFDFDSERAERKLDLVALQTKRSKDDIVFEEDWEGYKVKDVLAFLRVEDYKSLTITSRDGYSVDIMKEQIDDETILAISINGEVLSEADNMVQLVQNTKFATTWIKGVATITVNE